MDEAWRIALTLTAGYFVGMYTSFYFLVKWDETFHDGGGSYFAFVASLGWPLWFPFYVLHRKASGR